jgi:hypothetical protein
MNEETRRPDGTLAETVVDHGDGTATRTSYLADGETVDQVEQLEGLPVVEPDPGPVDVPSVLEAIRQPLDGLTSSSTSAQQRTALLGLRAAIDDLLGGTA